MIGDALGLSFLIAGVDFDIAGVAAFFGVTDLGGERGATVFFGVVIFGVGDVASNLFVGLTSVVVGLA